MTAYFIPNQEKEDMYLNFNNVHVFSAPNISTKQDKIVRARAQDGKYYNIRYPLYPVAQMENP